jgi:hypothetical protein
MKLLNRLKTRRQKKSGKNLLLLLTLVCLASCRVKYAPPQVETCIHNEDSSAECNDLRLPKEQQSYTKYNLTNMICTNTDDYGALYSYASDLREKLIKCESQKND